MKRRTLFLLFAVASLLFAGYSAREFFFACMASSALVGVPSQLAAQHHYGLLSSVWLVVTLAAVVASIIFVVAAIRRRPTSHTL